MKELIPKYKKSKFIGYSYILGFLFTKYLGKKTLYKPQLGTVLAFIVFNHYNRIYILKYPIKLFYFVELIH